MWNFFYTHGHNPYPLLSFVNQCFSEDFLILFYGVVVWGLCGYVMGVNLKLLRHSYPKHRGMGFRKRFFYWDRGLRFDM
jgi:hypothetical protein